MLVEIYHGSVLVARSGVGRGSAGGNLTPLRQRGQSETQGPVSRASLYELFKAMDIPMIPAMMRKITVRITPHFSFAGVQRRDEFLIEELLLDKEVIGVTDWESSPPWERRGRFSCSVSKGFHSFIGSKYFKLSKLS